MKKAAKILVWAVLIVAVVGVLGYFGYNGFFSVTQYSDGFLPYGESPNGITGLNKDIAIVNGDDKFSSATYWNITRQVFWDYQWTQTANFEGNDFELTSYPESGGNNRAAITTWITNEDFSERDFKAKLIGISGGCLGTPKYGVGTVSMLITLVQPNGNRVEVMNYGFPITDYADLNLQISPSPISEKVKIYTNGELTNTLSVSGDYRIEIAFTQSRGSTCGQSNAFNAPSYAKIKNAAYKSQYGCTINPDEQYYARVYKEGQTLALEDFSRFSKFCLDENPAKLYTNAGSAKNTEILELLINGEELTVPTGQIWSIEYIGKKPSFGTSCEDGTAFLENQQTCVARTLLTLQCATGSTFDSEAGICTTETAPAPYITGTIETHQNLALDGQFLYTHILSQGKFPASSSFQLFGSTFNSAGVFYKGQMLPPLDQSKDSENWVTKFSYGGQEYEARKGDEITLSDKLKVRLNDLQAYYSKSKNSVIQYKAEYIFTPDTSGILTEIKNNSIIITNNFAAVEGGVTITKEDALSQTTVYTEDRLLVLGENKFTVDPTNLRTLKARPYIKVTTPDGTYALDARTADSTEQGFRPIKKLSMLTGLDPEYIWAILTLLLLIVIAVIYIIKRKK